MTTPTPITIDTTGANASLDYSTATNSYTVILTGTGNDTVTGSQYNDSIKGGDGADLLKGGACWNGFFIWRLWK